MKNKDNSRNEELKTKLDAKLAALDRLANSLPVLPSHVLSQFLEGPRGTAAVGRADQCRGLQADASAVSHQARNPFHCPRSVAVPHYMKHDALAKYDSVRKYLNAAMQTDAFKKSAYTPETVIWGWSKFF
eukprot:748733-Hanusia_phi.AAC.5